MASEQKIRTFLAVPLAPLFQEAVSPLVEKLRTEYPEVRWVSPSQIHITLHFFGSVGECDLPEIIAAVNPIVRKTRLIKIHLEDMGAFPNLKRPRVIWLGVKGEIGRLEDLQASLEQELSRAGFSGEERRFKPHLTLGRVRENGKSMLRLPLNFGPTESRTITEITLFKSALTSEGANYEAITTFPLSTP